MARVAFLWDSFPSYASTCIATLARQEDINILAYGRSEGAFPDILDQLRKCPNIILFGKDGSGARFEAFILQPGSGRYHFESQRPVR